MKLSLSSNIQKFRKEKGLTQEQLAESLGVTFAAVSKWERGVATPDLDLIASMANLFGISVDTLIGFKLEDNTLKKYTERVNELFAHDKYEEALSVCEEALFRYPNNYDVVHDTAVVNFYIGTKTDNPEYYKKAINLLERSLLIVPKNPEKPYENEITITSEIAQTYMLLRDFDKAVELFKKSNVDGLYDPLIAYSITMKNDFTLDEVKPYIRSSFSGVTRSFLHTMFSLSIYYQKSKEYDKGIECMLWFKEFLNGLKKNPKEMSYFDKVVSVIYVEIAKQFIKKNDVEQAKKYLDFAYNQALKFDKNPTYRNVNIKYMLEDEGDMFADGFGNTALIAIEKQISKTQELAKLYVEVKK